MTQMIRHSTPQAPSQPRRRPDVPESVAQQDDIIRGIVATEEELAQQEGMVVSDPSDSFDDDYVAIPRMPPQRHDHEADNSSLAPPALQTDPTLLAILERMR